MDAYFYDQFEPKTSNLQFRYFMTPFPYFHQAEIRRMSLGFIKDMKLTLFEKNGLSIETLELEIKET